MKQLAHFELITKECADVKSCPHCHTPKSKVKRLALGVNKLIVSREVVSGPEFKPPKDSDLFAATKVEQPFTHFQTVELTPQEIIPILEKINPNDWQYLLSSPTPSPPSSLICSTIPVPPLQLRPTVSMTAENSTEDDSTIKLCELVRAKNDALIFMQQGKEPFKIDEQLYTVQLAHNQFVNSDSSESKSVMIKLEDLKGLLQRLKGKPGRFRGNLQGKRVEYSARTVISPDPNLCVDQVAVPLRIACELTFPEIITHANFERLRRAVENGPRVYPGASHVEIPGEEGRLSLFTKAARQEIAALLRPGVTVHRHLMKDDFVLFNRQPSLHRQSIMAMRATISADQTLKFNECVCSPFNADFDGDEMNLHLPQTLLARAESAHLMRTTRNILSSRNGEANIALIQDFYTTVFNLTSREFLCTPQEAAQLLFSCGVETKYLPRPCIVYPSPLFSGKQLLSAMIKNCGGGAELPSVRLREKAYKGHEKREAFDANEGFAVIRHGVIQAGRLGKTTLGGARGSFTRALIGRCGQNSSATLLNTVAKLSSRMIEHFGISFSLRELVPSESVQAFNKKLIEEKFAECARVLEKSANAVDADSTTRKLEDEATVTQLLSSIRDEAGKFLMEQLSPEYPAVSMALSGAKGSAINISQMIATVGQQTVSGKRVALGNNNRTLPHFAPNDPSPGSRGFVANSYYTGLTPTEFFFHTMAGREGLIDTAVKTADTGYMQRRLVKVMEDLVIEYDFSVRNSEKRLIQFVYGDDALDPQFIEEDIFPLRLSSYIDSWQDPSKEELDEFIKTHEKRFSQISLSIDERLEIVTSPPTEHYEIFVEKLWNPMNKALTVGFSPKLLFVLKKLYNLLPTLQNPEETLTRISEVLITRVVNPGEAVGSLTSQSLGEPCTQMTLKTFHFAGVASMNVTLGVPRINEIFNAIEKIRTPIIEVSLINKEDKIAANFVKNKINKVCLAEILSQITEVFQKEAAYILLDFNTDYIQRSLRDFDIQMVKTALISSKLKLKDKHVEIKSNKQLRIESPLQSAQETAFYFKSLIGKFETLIVYGLNTVNRALISQDKSEKLHIFAEGTGLYGILRIMGVDYRRTKTNNIQETREVLGIEAARSKIVSEANYIMSIYGISIDFRHYYLLADTMCFTGKVVGLNRYGITKMKNSPMMLASFETTGPILFDAAFFGSRDKMAGISEKIIIGDKVELGTGKFEVLTEA